MSGISRTDGHPFLCSNQSFWSDIHNSFVQDLADDKKLGLKSTAISFGENPRLWLGGFSSSMISFLGVCGLMNGQTWPYYTSLLVISAHLAKQVSFTQVPVNYRSIAGSISVGQIPTDKQKEILMNCRRVTGSIPVGQIPTNKKNSNEPSQGQFQILNGVNRNKETKKLSKT